MAESMLFCDLEAAWRGFHSEEECQAAWTTCDAIATAVWGVFRDDTTFENSDGLITVATIGRQ